MKSVKLEVQLVLVCISLEVLLGPEAAALSPSPCSGTHWPGSLVVKDSKGFFLFE